MLVLMYPKHDTSTFHHSNTEEQLIELLKTSSHTL